LDFFFNLFYLLLHGLFSHPHFYLFRFLFSSSNQNFSLSSGKPCTPEPSFNSFYLFFDSYHPKLSPPSPQFLYWFIGFSEADGGWYSFNNRHTFVIRQKYIKVLEYCYNNLHLGIITHDSDGYFSYKVFNSKEICILKEIFKGNLFLYYNIFKWYPILYSSPTSSILTTMFPLPLFHSFLPSLNNGWLSGFTQGDGGFNVSITKRTDSRSGYRVRLRFYLDQKNSEIELLFIQSLLCGGYVSPRSGSSMFRYTLDSHSLLFKIKNYFLTYPLVGSKSNFFNHWLEILNIIDKKNHLTQEGINQIFKLKSEMNSFDF